MRRSIAGTLTRGRVGLGGSASAPGDGEHLDRLRDPLEVDGARVVRGDGPLERVEGRARDDDLTLAGQRPDTRGLVDADAGEVESARDGVGAVDTDADGGREAVRLAMVRELALDRDRALDRGIGRCERHNEAVTLMADLLSAVLGDARAERVVVPADQVAPRVIADDPDEAR